MLQYAPALIANANVAYVRAVGGGESKSQGVQTTPTHPLDVAMQHLLVCIPCCCAIANMAAPAPPRRVFWLACQCVLQLLCLHGASPVSLQLCMGRACLVAAVLTPLPGRPSRQSRVA